MNKGNEDLKTAITKLEKQFQSKSCRICLNPVNIRTSINLTNRIIENIKFCTGIWIRHNDKLPTQICKCCHKSLAVASKFKKMCLEAQSICENLLNDTVKVELSVIKEEDSKKFNIKSYVHDHSYGCSCDEEQGKFTYAVIEECVNNVKEEPKAAEIEDIDTTETLTTQNLASTEPFETLSTQDLGSTEPFKTWPVQRTVEARRRPIKQPRPIKLHCRWCKIQFNTREEALKHKELHSSKSPYTCQVCGKSFKHYTAHYLHVRTHRQPNFECDHCGYRTAVKYAMSVHMRIHSDAPKKYRCDQCPSAYHTSSNLAKHRHAVHERARRYACHVCGATFYGRYDLNKHVDGHSNVRRFECELCGVKLAKRYTWKIHMRKQHGVELPRHKPGRRKVYQIVDDGTPGDQPHGETLPPDDEAVAK